MAHKFLIYIFLLSSFPFKSNFYLYERFDSGDVISRVDLANCVFSSINGEKILHRVKVTKYLQHERN